MKIAFDVDDTLIIPAVATNLPADTPNYELINVYRWFQKQGHEMIIWSGGGVDYAKTWGEKLGLAPFEVRRKETLHSICSIHKEPIKQCHICDARYDVDIVFDDCVVDLAKVNIQVKRYNNSISRKEWNQHKVVDQLSDE